MLALSTLTTTKHHYLAMHLLFFAPADLRAVVHAVMCIACPFVVRTDCKGVYNLCKAIFEGKDYDRKHNDADLLNQIATIHAQNPLERVIEWMPAHLDDPKNAAKRANFLLMEARKSI